jgi:hypothetical protein
LSETEYKKLHDSAKRKRQIHEPELIDVYAYAYPQRRFRQDLLTTDNPVDRALIYDSTAGLGVRNLSTWTMRSLLPQEMKFAEIVVRNNFRNANDVKLRLKDQLSEANDRLHDHFIRRDFYQTTWEIIKDGIVGGTFCCFIDDRPGEPLDYRPIPIDELYFLESYRGDIDCVFRDHMVTGRMMKQEGWDIPRSLKEQIKNDPTFRHRCTEAIIPNGRKFDHLIWYGNCEIIHKGTMRLNPYVVTRWERILGHPWGNRPTRSALPDIRSLNRVVEDAVVFGRIVSHGAWIIEGDFGDARYIEDFVEPGCAVHVDSGTKITEMPMPGNFSLNMEFQREFRAQVNNHMMNMQLPPADKAVYMKAETAQLLKSQWESQIGEPALRLQREYLQKIADQAAKRLFLRGELGVVDTDKLRDYGARNQAQTLDKVFRVDTNAMLTMLMKRQKGRDAMAAYQAGIATFGPEVIANITDIPELAKDALVEIGLSRKYIIDKKKREPLEFAARAASLNTAVQANRTPALS